MHCVNCFRLQLNEKCEMMIPNEKATNNNDNNNNDDGDDDDEKCNKNGFTYLPTYSSG